MAAVMLRDRLGDGAAGLGGHVRELVEALAEESIAEQSRDDQGDAPEGTLMTIQFTAACGTCFESSLDSTHLDRSNNNETIIMQTGSREKLTCELLCDNACEHLLRLKFEETFEPLRSA